MIVSLSSMVTISTMVTVITTIVTIAVVVVPPPTKPVDEVVQSVAHIVPHVRTSGGSSKSACRIYKQQG